MDELTILKDKELTVGEKMRMLQDCGYDLEEILAMALFYGDDEDEEISNA